MIYLLPGMGATSAMYDHRWQTLDGAIAVEWPLHQGETTLEKVANRLINEYGICSNDTVVGSSLGGMVALEIHRQVKLRHVFLLGSAVSANEINPALFSIAWLAKLLPWKLMQWMVGKGFNKVSGMFAQADPDFIRAMCLGVKKWSGYNQSKESITRIHGKRDWIIRCPHEAHILPDGGHLIAMTHAEECIELINKTILGSTLNQEILRPAD